MNNLSDEQIDAIAEKAAEKAVEKMTSYIYREVGKSVVSKLFYIVGALVIGTYVYVKNFTN